MQRWPGALILPIPVPLGNILPGLPASVIALGIPGRDGLWLLIGLAVRVISLAVILAPIGAGAFLLANIIA